MTRAETVLPTPGGPTISRCRDTGDVGNPLRCRSTRAIESWRSSAMRALTSSRPTIAFNSASASASSACAERADSWAARCSALVSVAASQRSVRVSIVCGSVICSPKVGSESAVWARSKPGHCTRMLVRTVRASSASPWWRSTSARQNSASRVRSSLPCWALGLHPDAASSAGGLTTDSTASKARSLSPSEAAAHASCRLAALRRCGSPCHCRQLLTATRTSGQRLVAVARTERT